MPISDSYNFREIDKSITTSGIVRRGQLKALGTEGYEVVVNLLPESSKYAVASERKIIESQGIKYIYIPVDFDAPSLDDFASFESALDSVVGKKVHVHCAANYRVSVFYSLYAERCGNWSFEQSQAFIGSLWDPGCYGNWPEFIQGVRDRNA